MAETIFSVKYTYTHIHIYSTNTPLACSNSNLNFVLPCYLGYYGIGSMWSIEHFI